jgi:hypothetical protein
MDSEKMRRIFAVQAMMIEERCMVGKCACYEKTYHSMGARCCICGFYANSECKMVSRSEYDEIVANAEKIKIEYEEKVRKLRQGNR